MTPDNTQIAFASEMPTDTLIDPFGRRVDYLRVSVTDRCDFRCVYCMAEEMTFLPKAELLSLEELEILCRRFMAAGVKKIRLTGGEPLVRRNIMQFISALAFVPKGRRLASGARDGGVAVWDLRSDGEGIVVAAALVDEVISALTWRPDGRALAALDAKGGVTAWRVRER